MSTQMNTSGDTVGQTEVLIVGAGPTGLMLANQLARRGVRPLIIDHHSGPAQQTRAMAVQARTLEIYAQLGVATQALALGARGQGANMWANGRHKARIPIGDVGKDLSPFPYVLMLGQDDNERILGDKLGEWQLGVQWNTELVALEQHDDHVAITLKQADGTSRQLRADWVAGCDGSRSTVREQCGIGFPGAPYEHVFFVADTVAGGDMVADELNVYLWKQGFHLFFPMRGANHWRVIGILPAALRDRTDITFDDIDAHIRATVGTSLTFQECKWFSTYRIQHRSAEKFREQRCFLLGDAAHVHSPMGAQGMNTGLQDAYNLAWKLAAVIKGEADAALLDSYAAERMPVAETLLHTTDRLFMSVVADTWLATLFRTKIIARVASVVMRRPRAQRFFFRAISQIGINYRHGPLSQTASDLPATAPQAGDRFPWLQLRPGKGEATQDLFAALDDTRFNLLMIGHEPTGDIEHAFGNRIHTLVVTPDPANAPALAAANIVSPGCYLLRPDGHIALAATRLDAAAIERFFVEHHLRAMTSKPATRQEAVMG